MRDYVPRSVKRFVRLQQRALRDRRAGYDRRFARGRKPDALREVVLTEIRQPIFHNPLAANKVESIRIATGHVQAIEIRPGEIFSFWETVGPPDAKRGFKVGRTIIAGRLQEDVGGGLCQVSGMIYHLALTTGMTILERYSHTVDLYEEGQRYTPLGADAGVVYGYKDLRFENVLPEPVYLTFAVNSDSFVGRMKSTELFPTWETVFEREEHDSYRVVRTVRTSPDGHRESLGSTTYQRAGQDTLETT